VRCWVWRFFSRNRCVMYINMCKWNIELTWFWPGKSLQLEYANCIVVGQQIIDALENGVSKYPTLEGRFPQVSGITFGFDPTQLPGQRIDPRHVKVQGSCIKLHKVVTGLLYFLCWLTFYRLSFVDESVSSVLQVLTRFALTECINVLVVILWTAKCIKMIQCCWWCKVMF